MQPRTATAWRPAPVTAWQPTPMPAPPAEAPARVLAPLYGSSSGSGNGDGAAAAAAAPVSLTGTVHKVQFRAPDTAYTVLKMHVDDPLPPEGGGAAAAAAAAAAPASPHARGRARRQLVTVVGALPQVSVGQAVRVCGAWATHPQYGRQLRAAGLEELQQSDERDLVAYLSGGLLPGVGPATARRMVKELGLGVEAALDGPGAVAALRRCPGIGRATAEKIKAAWDLTQGTREGVAFLRQWFPPALAHRVAERYGPQTRACVVADPYAALAPFGVPFARADAVAAAVGAPPDLVSRGAMALDQRLLAAATEGGHTYQPWASLERDTGRLLEESALHHGLPWAHNSNLHLVAMHMHVAGQLVAEPAHAREAAAAAGAAELAAAAPVGSGGDVAAASSSASSGGGEGAGRTCRAFGSREEAQAFVQQHIPGVGATYAGAMVGQHGEGILGVLDLPFQDSVRELARCRKIGPKTAEKIKLRWDASQGAGRGADAPASASASHGLTMARLLADPPPAPLPWGPATRCYVPHLHAAEVAVAARALQQAAALKRPRRLHAARIRQWIVDNQRANPGGWAAGVGRRSPSGEHRARRRAAPCGEPAARSEAGAGSPLPPLTAAPPPSPARARLRARTRSDIELNAGQRTAIEAASDAPLMVLTGGPGCGKTTVVQTIVKLWAAQRKVVRLCAPTGRAAQRIGRIQSVDPCTIHRLLRYVPYSAAAAADGDGNEAFEGGGKFEHNRNNPLAADAVLVDEASMLSLPLAAALFDALRPGAQLVLVGDVDQLPPVGPGAVLQSLIDSRLVPVVDLREIFRQAAQSAIVTSALAVRRGEAPRLAPAAPRAASLAAPPSDALLVAAPGAGALPGAVISPMRKGPAGTNALNPLLQAVLNPPAPHKAELARHGGAAAAAAAVGAGGEGSAPRPLFRVGDRVIQLVNNYDKEVYNGDQGTIVAVSTRERSLTVRFPHLAAAAGDGGGGDGLKAYSGVELSQLELAYAVTVHKAQGGEAEQVVLALSPAHARMLTRRLLYTGLTRAKQLLVVVSTPATAEEGSPLERAARCKDKAGRLTWLRQRLAAGAAERGLELHEAQVFSNEDEMLHLGCLAAPEPEPGSHLGRLAAPEPEPEAHGEKRKLQQQRGAGDAVALEQEEGLPPPAAAPGAEAGPALEAQLGALLGELLASPEEREVVRATVAPALACASVAGLAPAHEVLQSAARLRLGLALDDGAGLAELLVAVPRLLACSPEQLDRALGLALRLGPEAGAAGEAGGEGSLVDPIRRLLHSQATALVSQIAAGKAA
eukprot:scaffold3.g6365.t1